jgi:hypothetical protein
MYVLGLIGEAELGGGVAASCILRSRSKFSLFEGRWRVPLLVCVWQGLSGSYSTRANEVNSHRLLVLLRRSLLVEVPAQMGHSWNSLVGG